MFPLSLRNVEDLLAERGIDISHEAVRFWWNRFGRWCQGKFSAVPAVLASAHEQSVPLFQQLAGGHPSGRDDVRAIPACL
jgi:hypothetical protein